MDRVVEALSRLTGRTVRRGELSRPNDRRLRWIDVGEGPAVVLVAGSAETCLDWAPLLPRLARRHRVIAGDRAGSGASEPMPRLTIDAEVADLAALMERVGPSVLVGHSWGGLLVQIAASRRPDLVRGLVLEDATHEEVVTRVPLWMRLAERAMMLRVVAAHRRGRFERLALREGRRLAEASVSDAEPRDALVAAYRDSYARCHQVAMIRDESRLCDRGVPQLRRWRAAHRLPDVPLIALSAEDKPARLRELSVRYAESVRDEVPGAAHVLVDGSGHYIHRDRPDAVLAAIERVSRASAQ